MGNVQPPHNWVPSVTENSLIYEIMHYSSQLRSLWSQMLFSLGDYFTPPHTFKRWSMKWSAADWIPWIRGWPLTECLCLIHWGRQPTLQYSEPLNMNRCFWQKKRKEIQYMEFINMHPHQANSLSWERTETSLTQKANKHRSSAHLQHCAAKSVSKVFAILFLC